MTVQYILRNVTNIKTIHKLPFSNNSYLLFVYYVTVECTTPTNLSGTLYGGNKLVNEMY